MALTPKKDTNASPLPTGFGVATGIFNSVNKQFFTSTRYNPGSIEVSINGHYIPHIDFGEGPEQNEIRLVTPYPAGTIIEIFYNVGIITDTGTIQETEYKVGESVLFEHLTEPGLTDVVITILDSSNDAIIVGTSPMIDSNGDGVYRFSHSFLEVGKYTAIMESSNAQTKSILQVRIIAVNLQDIKDCIENLNLAHAKIIVGLGPGCS